MGVVKGSLLYVQGHNSKTLVNILGNNIGPNGISYYIYRFLVLKLLYSPEAVDVCRLSIIRLDGWMDGQAPSSSPRYPFLYIQSAVADVASNSGLRGNNNNNNLMDKGETWEIRNEPNHLSPYSPLIQGRRIELIVQTINRTRYLLLQRPPESYQRLLSFNPCCHYSAIN